MRIFNRKETLLFLIMLILSVRCFSQTDSIAEWPSKLSEKLVQFTGTIQLQDSQYLLITKLNVGINDSIEVRTHRVYDQMQYGGIDGRIWLQKNIRNHFANISVDAFNQYDTYDSTGKIPRTVIYQNQPLVDTIHLGNLFPFEIGNYRISAELEFLYRKKLYIASTEFIYFNSPIIPKSYLYE